MKEKKKNKSLFNVDYSINDPKKGIEASDLNEYGILPNLFNAMNFFSIEIEPRQITVGNKTFELKQLRRAGLKDFEAIFLREFDKSSMGIKTHFKELLISEVKGYIKLFRDLCSKQVEFIHAVEYRKAYSPYLELALSFRNWLDSLTDKNMPCGKEALIMFNWDIIEKIDSKCNGLIFEKLSKDDLYNALNFPEKNPNTIKFTINNKTKLHSMIYHLLLVCDNQEWLNNIFAANAENGLTKEYYKDRGSQRLSQLLKDIWD